MLPRPSVESLRGGGVDADDEHRIAYVAITRAKQELYILSKPSRAKGSGPVVGRYPYPVAA
jgi:superfamily I DNA/RNA helicase